MQDSIIVWRDLLHYEGLYQISNYGDVWDVKNQVRLNPVLNHHGYYEVKLTNQYGKRVVESIHRLVALTWVDNPNPKEFNCVNHKDENKTNNYYENLEWCTRGYNVSYSMKGKPKSPEHVEKMRANYEVMWKIHKHPMLGKKQSEESIKKNSESNKQYAWATNGVDNVRIKKSDLQMFLSNNSEWWNGFTWSRKDKK